MKKSEKHTIALNNIEFFPSFLHNLHYLFSNPNRSFLVARLIRLFKDHLSIFNHKPLDEQNERNFSKSRASHEFQFRFRYTQINN